jgi:thiol:disulfide interchange protein DsbD
MNITFFSRRRLLLAAACAFVGWLGVLLLCASPAAGAQDKADQAAYDPFSDLYQAIKLDENWKQKPAPPGADKASQVVDFAVQVEPKEAERGETVRVTVVGMPAEHWHLYALTKRAPDQTEESAVLKFERSSNFLPLPPVVESKPELIIDPNLKTSAFAHTTRFTWSFHVLALEKAERGVQEFPFKMSFQICANSCLYGRNLELKANINVVGRRPVPLTDDIKKRMQEKWPPYMELIERKDTAGNGGKKDSEAAKTTTANVGLPRDYKASMDRLLAKLKPAPRNAEAPEVVQEREQGIIRFMLIGMLWGFITLLTPCVFPMIPITVSYFLKQSEKEHHKPVTMAVVYCGTIVAVLTVAAAALLHTFRLLSVSPYMNFGLGILFIVFALSLFGMYDIELPAFLGRFTSERESRGGLVGTFFMALTFTIISFACVAPFLGGFGGTAGTEQRPWWHAVLGGFAFSVTFASPFFILALFPTLLKAMPKSGSWLNSVKVVMGFLELAAALKFFRAGELVNSSTGASLFTYDLVLGLWVGLCFLCGLYLLGVYRLPHDSPIEHLSVPRMLFSFVFLGLGVYLMVALFTPPPEEGPARPSGAIYAWVNSFLLPETRTSKGSEMWTGNLEHAVKQALEYRKKTGQPKRIFVDFTGMTCTNCKINENDVFSKSEIRKLFEQYILVQLFTDRVPNEFYAPEDQNDRARQIFDAQDVNLEFQRKAFNDEKLPLYVILEPVDENTILFFGPYREGKINDVTGFAEFLRSPDQKKKLGSTMQAGL